MCRQAGGSKYVILQKIYASIPVKVDDETPRERTYGSILYERLGWLALRWSCGHGSFLEVLRAIAGFDTSRQSYITETAAKG